MRSAVEKSLGMMNVKSIFPMRTTGLSATRIFTSTEVMVEEMNRPGILMDLSHVGYQTSMDAIRFSKRPVCLTHANPSSLVDHKRNKPDDLLKVVSKKGGIIGTNVFPPFIKAGALADLSDLIRLIDYLVNLVGIDHVGIGSDFTENQGEDFFRAILLPCSFVLPRCCPPGFF
jgi:microsomal dipeptidase-like Zn-dependent dipeptidase